MTTWTTAKRRHHDPYYGKTVTLRIVQPVCDDANYLPKLGWRLLGIIGNNAHWMTPNAEDHTSRSVDVGRKGRPKAGWVYAIDVDVPASKKAGLRDAILKRARSGKLPQLKYFNIGHRHYNQADNFKTYVYSGDDHLHLSYERTYETTKNRSILKATLGDNMDSKDAKTLFMADVTPAPRIAENGTKAKAEDIKKNPTWAQHTFSRNTLEELREMRREMKMGLDELGEQVKVLREEVEALSAETGT